jgi:hypothetical protein
MKITKAQLKKIIQEELAQAVQEGEIDEGFFDAVKAGVGKVAGDVGGAAKSAVGRVGSAVGGAAKAAGQYGSDVVAAGRAASKEADIKNITSQIASLQQKLSALQGPAQTVQKVEEPVPVASGGVTGFEAAPAGRKSQPSTRRVRGAK